MCLCIHVCACACVCVSECFPIYHLCTGSGVEPDMKKSAEIFTDLALKGHPFAQVYVY